MIAGCKDRNSSQTQNIFDQIISSIRSPVVLNAWFPYVLYTNHMENMKSYSSILVTTYRITQFLCPSLSPVTISLTLAYTG